MVRADGAVKRQTTSLKLRAHGRTVSKVWAMLVRERGRSRGTSTEMLFRGLRCEKHPEWWGYMATRYPWLAT